tara:strand:- start:1000 stop:1242 length:243 start_codon:yes stop_codon:yes gene_type:complete
MNNLRSKILSLDVADNIKSMLLNRVNKIKGCKVLIKGDSVEIIPKYYKELHKKKVLYSYNCLNMRWLELDDKYGENIIIC